MNQYKVSIIIPVYNAERFIAETIHSAINQTYKNIEIIIIDDGSTDNSYLIAKSFENKMITVVWQKNSGASAARNYGLSLAKGKFIQFLDADDLISQTKIEEQVKLLDRFPNHIAVCSTIHFFETKGIENLISNDYEDSFLTRTKSPTEFLTNLWGGNSNYGSMVAIHAWLTPKSIIDGIGTFNLKLNYDDDGEFFARAILQSNGIVYAKKVYSYYRKQNTSSLSDLDSEDRLTSMLTSALIKKDLFLKQTNSYNAQFAIYKMLTSVALKCLPKYYSLYKSAIKARPKIAVKNYQPSVGGPITQKLATIFGWKIIRLIQYYLGLKK